MAIISGVDAPSISLPKGGGAIRGIGEKFGANPVTGTGSLSVPIPVSPGRSGFGPQLSLSYDSGAGNGPFGFGWHLSLPSVTRKTDKGLPRYDDAAESDVFLLSGAEDLVPHLTLDPGHGWIHTSLENPPHAPGHRIDRYRPRVEGLFARVERWTRTIDGDVHWRSITPGNITTIYGKDANSRIQDGTGPGARVFSWLICQSHDDKGNAMVYTYKPEDGAGVDLAAANERNRTAASRSANRHLTSVRYGNRVSRLVDPTLADPGWMFEAVFDYGEHDAADPTPGEAGTWTCRRDPFSTYRAGFEVRTYRLCRRVLMFHHFPDAADVGRDCLVRSLDVAYKDDVVRGNPVASVVAAFTQNGYRRDNSGYAAKSLPPLEFGYSEPVISDDVGFVDPASLANLPAGVDGTAYRWVDLDGDGVQGVLTEQAGGWFSKPGTGGGRFGAVEVVAAVPSAGVSGKSPYHLLDLAGDGQLDLVELSGPTPGFAERTEERSWSPFVPFRSLPNVDWDDPNLRFVDLSGDGHADVLVTEDEALVWYPSLGEDGFGAARRVGKPDDEEAGPTLVFADGQQSVHLADMSGDGLADLVRIRNGEVCYWPSLGYGRFGAKVSMDDAPWFEPPEQFEQRRIRIADIDGSGTADLIYLAADGVRVWFNQSGNRWSQPHHLAQAPAVEDASALIATDLLGNGTACLVWSSPLPADVRGPMRFIDLMGGQKPHLLTSVRNNLGAETRITYAPSTRFLLADRAAGRPWITRLPFPVHVVERVETYDQISGNRFVTRYAYHHGYFDGAEREFRGFGMVEQWDTEEYSDGDAATTLPPVLTRTWFHTGGYEGGARVSRAYADGYYGDEPLLPDTVLPTGAPELTTDELREACRALKGALLRQEVYAVDGTGAAGRPYTVAERTYTVRLIQPRGGGRHAVFFPHPREDLSLHYERRRYVVGGTPVDDPRVTHTVTLEVDEYGNVVRSAAIGYGRRHDDPDPQLTEPDRARQRDTLATLTENRFTKALLAGTGAAAEDVYRTPLPCETRTSELTGPGLTQSRRLRFADVASAVSHATVLEYDGVPDTATWQKRTIEHVRTRYRSDDLTRLLPLAELEPRALPGETERCAFTPGLVTDAYGTRVTDTMLGAAGYVHSDGDANWWMPSGRSFHSPDTADPPAQELVYATRHFFLPHRFADPFGHVTTVGYDADDLLPVQTTDPVSNTVRATNDYRVLAPAVLTDPNRNRSAVTFDELGMVTTTAVRGKAGETDPAKMGDTPADPTTRLEYRLSEWVDHGRPAVVRTLARERHGAANTRWLETYSYSDGFGREIQRKALAEPGPLTAGGAPADPRWVGSGWVVFNNKGKPVKRYEPFFSAAAAFEVVQHGVGSTLCYDPVGRVVATLHPNHTYEKVVVDPWRLATWDVNDTVMVTDPADDPDVGAFFRGLPGGEYLPTWYTRRVGGARGAAEQAAAREAAAHADTPTAQFLDALGRPFLTVADNGADGRYATRVAHDIEGNVRAVTDPRGVVVMAYSYDMLGTVTRSGSADAGTRRGLTTVLGKPAWSWDDRGFTRRMVHDAHQRPTELYVDDGGGERLAERTVYGEARGEADNHRGRTYQVFDAAGVATTTAYDFTGNAVATTRQLLSDYRDPVDWSASPPLDPEVFTASTTYDALNRPTSTATHDGSVIRPGYNEAGLLERLDADLRGAPPVTLLSNVDYNARGQRELAAYPITDAGGGPYSVEHRFGYDPLTFRLAHLAARRTTDNRRLQDLGYTYDPTGNVTALRDDAQPTVYYDNQQVPAGGDYVYDAVYRLVEATGREHDGSGTVDPPSNFPHRNPHYDGDDWTRRNKTNPNDRNALRRYTETYTYDSVGNILSLNHQPFGASGWTRRYEYSGTGNRLLGTSLPGDAIGAFSARYAYDAHGNMLSMPHLPVLEWDVKDQLHMSQRQVVTAGVGERTYYVYDSAGQRVRTVTEWPGGSVKDERIYLGGLEYYRAYTGSGTLDLERETLHVMDGRQRVALVETKTRENDAAVTAPQPAIRYQLDNHLGSSVLELDEHGDIISYEEYHAYGTTAYQAGRSVAEVSLKRYRYTGKERDEETGLYYHGARYYAPWLCRWTSWDPNGADGTNRYAYVSGNPVRMVDPDGRAKQDAIAPVPWGLPLGEAIARAKLNAALTQQNEAVAKHGWESAERREAQARVNAAHAGVSGEQEWQDFHQNVGLPIVIEAMKMAAMGPIGGAVGGAVARSAPLLAKAAVVTFTFFASFKVGEAIEGHTTSLRPWAFGEVKPIKGIDRLAHGVEGGSELVLLFAGATGPKPAAEMSRAGPGDKYAKDILPGGRADKQTVLAGHGEYRAGSGNTVVPEGTRLHMYSEHGTRIDNRLGLKIEGGEIGAESATETFGPGATVKDYTLVAPDESVVIRSESTTVEDATRLSDLLKPNMGDVHWAACRSFRVR